MRCVIWLKATDRCKRKTRRIRLALVVRFVSTVMIVKRIKTKKNPPEKSGAEAKKNEGEEGRQGKRERERERKSKRELERNEKERKKENIRTKWKKKETTVNWRKSEQNRADSGRRGGTMLIFFQQREQPKLLDDVRARGESSWWIRIGVFPRR